MDDANEGPMTRQDLVADPPQANHRKKLAEQVAVIILTLVSFLILYSAITYSNQLGGAQNMSTSTVISSSTLTTSTVPATTTTTVRPNNGTIQTNNQTAPSHPSSTSIPSTTSTIPQGPGKCPCPTEAQISSLFGSPTNTSGAAFNFTYLSNSSQVGQLQALDSNSLPEAEAKSISGGWALLYRGGAESNSIKLFSEHVVVTTQPKAISNYLSPLIFGPNTVTSTGSATGLNYTYSTVNSGYQSSLALVGYKGGYAVYATVLLRSNESVESVVAIAQQISASLG